MMAAPPFSAHLGYLFTELPLETRMAAARQAGFDAVEHPQPFAIPAARMAGYLMAEELTFSQMAAATGNAAHREKGLTALPGREADFREALERSLDYAETIGCPFVHPLAGVPPAESEPAAVWDVYLGNLGYAVERCAARKVKILIEAISTVAVPGYFMSTMELALRAADAIGPDRIHFLIDTFHACATGFDAEAFIVQHANRVGHVHIADHPGRHEPGTGTVDFMRLLDTLKVAGYGGAIGFEYTPMTDTLTGLGWLPFWKQRLHPS